MPVSGPRNWSILSVSGPGNHANPFITISGARTDKMCQFLGPESVMMGQHRFWCQKCPIASMGVLAPRLRTLAVSARSPINRSGYLLAHLSAESPLNISPNLSEVISKVSELFKIPPFPPKYVRVRGVGAVPKYFFMIGMLIILLLMASWQVSEL
jgi:hypothetical protein